MASERVGDMTLDELKAIIEETVVRLREMQRPSTKLTVAEVVATVRRHRPTLPPGAPSNQELLREDRDR